MKLTAVITLSLFAGSTLSAQTLNLSGGACQSITAGKTKVLVYVPTVIGALTVPVPICVTLGAGLAINMTNTAGPSLEYTPPPIAPVTPVVFPHMVLERVVFGATIPATQTTLGWTLAKTPAPGTMIIAVLQSSMIGENTVDIVDFNVATPKVVTITLPTYRPFPNDGVLLQYWTLEP